MSRKHSTLQRRSFLAVAAFGAAFALSGIASISSMTAAATLAAACAVTRGAGDPVTKVALVVLAVVIVRHQANIRRLIRGEESRMRRR